MFVKQAMTVVTSCSLGEINRQMTDQPIRTYTADDVREIVELLDNDPDMSEEKFSGMERLAEILKHFEGKTEVNIEAECRDFFRSERLR